MNVVEQNKAMVVQFHDAGYLVVVDRKKKRVEVFIPNSENIVRTGDAAEGDMLMADMYRGTEFSIEDYILIFYMSQKILGLPELKADPIICTIHVYAAKDDDGTTHLFTKHPLKDNDGKWRAPEVGPFAARLISGALPDLDTETVITINLEANIEQR